MCLGINTIHFWSHVFLMDPLSLRPYQSDPQLTTDPFVDESVESRPRCPSPIWDFYTFESWRWKTRCLDGWVGMLRWWEDGSFFGWGGRKLREDRVYVRCVVFSVLGWNAADIHGCLKQVLLLVQFAFTEVFLFRNIFGKDSLLWDDLESTCFKLTHSFLMLLKCEVAVLRWTCVWSPKIEVCVFCTWSFGYQFSHWNWKVFFFRLRDMLANKFEGNDQWKDP